jgi:DNA-binding Xre family transcriptional regulator
MIVMEIKLDVQKVAIARGITTAYQLQKALDAYPSEAAKLWNSQVKQVSLTMLGRLCAALECEPGDLLVRVEEGTPTKKTKK